MSLFGRVTDIVRLRWLRRNEYESQSLRRWFKARHDVEVGMYSYGCFDPWRIPAKTRIGRYCSFAKTARILDANHPMEALTTHPFLYEARFGIVDANRIETEWLIIEDDVWISHNAVITPGCKFIGRGAVIGAGAIVTRAVERYEVVAGVPARKIRNRFSPEVIAVLEKSRWWKFDKLELKRFISLNPEAAFNVSSWDAARGGPVLDPMTASERVG